MNKKLNTLFFLLLVNTLFIKASNQASRDFTKDTTSFLSAIRRGTASGNLRYFYMHTRNESGLTNYYAHAVGMRLFYLSKQYHGFQFFIQGSFTGNIASSNLAKADNETGQFNRYEIGLFDIGNPRNKLDMSRLEALSIYYNFGKSFIHAGRQFISSPFINEQDGRMQTTAVRGILVEVNEIKKLKLSAAWIESISPRSTNKWYTIDQTIGLYPSGVSSNGAASQYKFNLKSKGIFLLGADIDLNKKFKMKILNQFVENIFNTSLIQFDAVIPLKNESTLLGGAQLIYQEALNYGGNKDAQKSYFEAHSQSLTYGLKIGWKTTIWEATLNYNRITDQGRYLMPREWGNDPFFTFLPRERNEGLANASAYVLKLAYRPQQSGLKTTVGAGYFKLPDVKNFADNKYNMPTYGQLNLDLRYNFKNHAKGLNMEFLIVQKIGLGDTYNNKKYVINKVNMIQYNFIINYTF